MNLFSGSSRRRGRRALSSLTVLCMLFVAARAAGPLGPSDRPEAYFNGSSYIRLSQPISLKQLVGLQFRTCVGGELFSQRFAGYTLHVTALLKQVVVSWVRPGQQQREQAMDKSTLDNKWHWVALNYQANPPSLLLEVDKETKVISNRTLNPSLLSPGNLQADGAEVLVGNVFVGCIHEGPQLEFHANSQLRNVEFGDCPLTNNCTVREEDVLQQLLRDRCYNEPCMRHGTCISRLDNYECHCSARYTGKNCEVDTGDPCASAPCQHAGRCVEDSRGDYKCYCDPRYHGLHCELEVSEDPLCVAGPCRNNGSCSVPPGADTYVCSCPPGYTGRNCETDVDECLSAGASVACLNGGRCVDAVNNYTCDCSNTGYTGARCESNVNECLEERDICGHNGLCYDTYGSFVCVCQPGYTGERCHRMLPSPCASNPCGAGGECSDDGPTDFHCKCRRGWSPPLCATPIPPSCEVTCPPRSHCKETGLPTMVTGVMIQKQLMCVCDMGFYGAPGLSPNCTTLEQACESGVCQNGATCSLGTDHFNCTCAPGYKGAYCELAAAKALSDLKAPPERCAAQPCVHADTCQDLPSGFRCECSPGWSGPRCDAPACTPPCLNGGACEDGACTCRAGYTGAACELPDCRVQPCPHKQECLEQNGVWHCLAAPHSACASSPCNNGSCVPRDTGFVCQCQPGTTGKYCDADIDECSAKPKICNHGVCVNSVGSYQCYCRPGYTGESCEQDINECLSAPCKHGGVCHDLENNFECTCKEGYEGKDCSIDINECQSSPCAAGSTCVDGVASYSCVCQDGLTGATCDVNIDDCESQPCQHGGRCIDGLNSYTCDCSNTGYAGARCAVNIDECASQPCRNGATCRDLVSDYRCDCHQGYSGKNCDVDINECSSSPCKYEGICVERSNVSLYQPVDGPPVQLGPQPHMVLPAMFYRPFEPENAHGFECICVLGTTGSRCEVNIDECASTPCRHGKCVDGVGEYTCECAPGFEGQHCEIEIDECLRYQPCDHGRCYDGRASYYCACEPGWGGRNCSVVLEGCRDLPCRNNGTCLPWLQNETEHRFNCSCTPGHHGRTCEKITTMSLEKRSYAEVNTTRDEGYDISFRFKTTLGNGLLAMGRGLTYFFLELSNGRLNLHSSLLNKWEGVFIGSNLNDSNWQKVFVTINSSHLVLAANEEQTIYPISQNEAYNSSITSFPSTRLGTAGSSYATVTHGPNYFVGCFQDVVVNNQWVLPEDSNATAPDPDEPDDPDPDPDTAARAQLHGVLASCPRREQCAPNPCRSGACEDAWTSFVCTCPRPHLGHTCQYNYTAATFGQESATPHSIVRVAVRDGARRAVHAALDISMFIRTRKPTGQIFYLGSMPRYGQTEETLVGASLKGGELLVHLRFNQTPEDYTVGGTRLDNGHLHLIQVVRNSTLVQVKLNGTEYFRKSISAAKQLDAQVLYLGGPPPVPLPPPETSPAPSPAPPAPSTPAPVTPRAPSDADYFKGVIQDVQISNGVNVTIVEFFPLRVDGLRLPASFGDVTLDPAGVLPGEVSDDACAARPCRNNATCANTWNDYTCACPRGYKGKQCAEVEFCQLQACPLNSHCRNLDGGYECISNATFDGVSTTLGYQLRRPRTAGTQKDARPPDSVTITFRTKVGGTLLRAESVTNPSTWFAVGVYKQQISLEWRFGAELEEKRSLKRPQAPEQWTTLKIAVVRDQLTASFVDATGHEDVGATATIDQATWQTLLANGRIYLGGSGQDNYMSPLLETSTDQSVFEYTEGDQFTMDNDAGKFFKGCMGAVYVGTYLLPFFTDDELYVGTAATKIDAQPHYALVTGRPWGADAAVGCVLCLEQDCLRGGRCADVRSSYACACPDGYSGDHCQTDVDECQQSECLNGATCRDEVANYTCVCPEGFTGRFCEQDIDECQSSPCQHGGECTDTRGGFTCTCPKQWRGARCETPRERTCAHQPCLHRGQCRDTPDPQTGNNYTCTCTEGYVGVHCEHAFCELVPCQHGRCVTELQEIPVCACDVGYSGTHCETERDECAEGGAARCLHGGTCRHTRGGYLCSCPPAWTGQHCEADVDECSSVSCGPNGTCENLPGSFICNCPIGKCGQDCALPDPCYPTGNETGPCEHGGNCTQRCSDKVEYTCACVDGWAGKNCSQQSVSSESDGGDSTSSTVLIAVGCALLAAAIAALALGALCAQARRKRATRGTYSPSGQEYCNPRAEMMHHALKPPPEERLI